MIIATGIDLAEVERIAASIERFGAHFLDRVYTAAERRYCLGKGNAAERLAARFAAKEAIMKALGTGWARGVRWIDLEVVRAASGKPSVQLHGVAAELAEQLGIRRWHLSLSHTREHAIAQVIAEGA